MRPPPPVAPRVAPRAGGPPPATRPPVPVTVDRACGVPLAAQLAAGLRAAAAGGAFRLGDRLPATRALARELAVSRTVVAAAYDELLAEGWIAGRHGSGTYVVAVPPTSPPRAAAPPSTAPPTGAAATAPPTASPPTGVAPPAVDLSPGQPWVEGLRSPAWRRAWRTAADVPPLLEAERAGLPAYRRAVTEHLLRHRGLVLDPGGGDVLATAGTTAALAEVVTAVLLPAARARGAGGPLRVAVEEPGYGRAVGALRALGVDVVPVRADEQGLRVDDVPDDVAAVFCTPAHQYPLGHRMPAARRVRLVERARRRGWWVVEDDYDGELRYDVAPPPLLAALGPDVVIHLGTTSKILTPALGAGWAVAPGAVLDAVLAHRTAAGTGPSAAGQQLLVAMAGGGDLARHLRALRRELAQRRALVVAAVREGGAAVTGDDAGAHALVPLPEAAAERALVAAGVGRGLVLDGLARHHVDVPRRHGLVVGYTGCRRGELEAALPVLTELLRAHLPGPGRSSAPGPSRGPGR